MKGSLFSTCYFSTLLESELESVSQQFGSLTTPSEEKGEGKPSFKFELYTFHRGLFYVRLLFFFIFASYSKRIKVLTGF